MSYFSPVVTVSHYVCERFEVGCVGLPLSGCGKVTSTLKSISRTRGLLTNRLLNYLVYSPQHKVYGSCLLSILVSFPVSDIEDSNKLYSGFSDLRCRVPTLALCLTTSGMFSPNFETSL